MSVFNRIKGAIFGAILFPCLPLLAACIGGYNALAPDRYKAPEDGFCEGIMVMGAAIPAVIMGVIAAVAFPFYGVFSIALAVGCMAAIGAVLGFILEGK